MPFDPSTPYNDLPPLPPPVESIETAADPEEVHQRPRRAGRAEAGRRADPERRPCSSTRCRCSKRRRARKSKTSSRRRTSCSSSSTRRRRRAADPATKEALRYRRALFEGVRKVQNGRLTVETAIDVCRTIKDETLDLRSKPGTTLRNSATGAVIYTPPVGKDLIREKLANWQEFLDGARRPRSADSLRGAALPVRGDPSVRGRQRPHGPNPQHSVSRAARAARHADSRI